MDVFTTITYALQLTVLICSVFLVARQFRFQRNSVVLGFFLYGLVCFLLNNIYWNSMNVLKPDVRIPYGVDDITETGAFLLFATMLAELYRDTSVRAGKEFSFTILYVIYSIILWNGWTGEWLRNLIGGVAFWYYLYVIILALKKSKALKKTETAVLAALAVFSSILQGVQFFVSPGIEMAIDVACNILLGTGMIWLLIRGVFALRKTRRERTQETARAALAITFGSVVWIQNGSYMTKDPMYTIEDFVLAFCLVLMVLSALTAIGHEPDVPEGGGK